MIIHSFIEWLQSYSNIFVLRNPCELQHKRVILPPLRSLLHHLKHPMDSGHPWQLSEWSGAKKVFMYSLRFWLVDVSGTLRNRTKGETLHDFECSNTSIEWRWVSSGFVLTFHERWLPTMPGGCMTNGFCQVLHTWPVGWLPKSKHNKQTPS